MSLFIDRKNGVIDDQYIQALKDDGIDAQDDVIEKVKQGIPEAVYEIGCQYASQENIEMATLWLGTSSALGVYESQLKLGDLFMEKDPKRAIKWYRQAQSNGIALAGTLIGDEFLKNKLYKEAEEEFIKAAEGGDPYSQNRLGVFYREGYYSRKGYHYSQDLAESFKLFQKAADQNFVNAQYNIGRMYEWGWGTAENKYKALYWYEKSKTGGYGGVDVAIKKLNKEGYFYFLHLENLSPFHTTTETAAPKSTTDEKRLVDLPELKKELQSLFSFDSTKNLVTVEIDDLMDMLKSTSSKMTE